MAYWNVFYALQEVFPQVDTRILKEVAIKHSSDADTAVEFVLSDVLPVITVNEPTEKYYPLLPDYGFEGDNKKKNPLVQQSRQTLYPTIENYNPIFYDAPSPSSPLPKIPNLEKNKQVMQEASSSSSPFVPNLYYPQANPFDDLPMDLNYDSGKDLIQLEDYSNLHYQPLNAFNAHGIENSEDNLMDSVVSEISEIGERKLHEKEPLLSKENQDSNENELENSNEIELEEEKKTEFESLDELIFDMTKNKELLSSALESTIIKMKEVEIEEENAKLAKEEIMETDKKTRSMVENIDQMIESTKEANFEREGEVEKEKSILENESKELYSKLVNLSAQKNEYLAAIHEINNTLDARLMVASGEKERAQKEIAEKEGAYLEIRKDKEFVLEEIIIESSRLEKEWEGNNMLRDFLVECGRKVDNLQGEISYINEEVTSLKQKLNECIQLNTPIFHTPVPVLPVPEPVTEAPVVPEPVTEAPVVPEPPVVLKAAAVQEVPMVLEAPVVQDELVPCSFVCSNLLEDHESTIFDGAKSILQNDYLAVKEDEKVKQNGKEKEMENNIRNEDSSDDEWEIY